MILPSKAEYDSNAFVYKLLNLLQEATEKVVDEEIEKAAEDIKQRAKERMKLEAMKICSNIVYNTKLDFHGPSITFTISERK